MGGDRVGVYGTKTRTSDGKTLSSRRTVPLKPKPGLNGPLAGFPIALPHRGCPILRALFARRVGSRQIAPWAYSGVESCWRLGRPVLEKREKCPRCSSAPATGTFSCRVDVGRRPPVLDSGNFFYEHAERRQHQIYVILIYEDLRVMCSNIADYLCSLNPIQRLADTFRKYSKVPAHVNLIA